MKTIIVSGVISIVLSACSTTTVAQNLADVPAADKPLTDDQSNVVETGGQTIVADSSLGTSLDNPAVDRADRMNLREESELVFNILSAEIAGRRGLVDIASENYYDASVATDDPRVSERAAKLALYARDWDRAGRASARWVKLEPESVEAWQLRAQASMHQRDVDTATDAMEQVVNLSDGGPGEVIPSLVDSILRQSDAELGSEVLKKLAARYPDNADTQYGIGRFAMSNGEREIALQSFERALEIDPDNVDALLARARMQLSAGDGDAGLEPVTAYLSRSPDDLSAQLGYARLLIETGKVDRAADQLEVIYQKFPTDADALYTIGLLALDITRVKSAESYLLSVVALDKHQDDANFYLGRISDSRNDYRQAIDRYKGVQGGDNFFAAQIRAGALHGQLGEVDESQQLFATLRTFTDDKSLQIEIISSESRMLNRNDMYDKSFEVLSGGLNQYNDDPALLYSRALVAERLDKRELFETDLKTVIEVQPDNSYALNALGYFLVDRNERLSEAEGYLVKAYELMPDDAAIIDSLGWLYYRQGRYADSIELLQKAYDLLPDTEIAAHLGEVLWVSGDQLNATKVWEEALSAEPDDDLLNRVMEKYIR